MPVIKIEDRCNTFTPELFTSLLSFFEEAHKHHPILKNWPFDKYKTGAELYRTIDLVHKKKAKILLATVDQDLAGVLIVTWQPEDNLWLERLWYPKLSYSIKQKVMILKALLRECEKVEKGKKLLFAIPKGLSSVGKILERSGFSEAETYYLKET